MSVVLSLWLCILFPDSWVIFHLLGMGGISCLHLPSWLASSSYTVASLSSCQGPVSHPVSNQWLNSCRGSLGLLGYWWLLSSSLYSVLTWALVWFFTYTPSWSWPSFCGVGPLLAPHSQVLVCFSLVQVLYHLVVIQRDSLSWNFLASLKWCLCTLVQSKFHFDVLWYIFHCVD